MAFASGNIANVLLQTLQNITSGSEHLVVTRESARAVDTLINVCTLLIDSAETVAEATKDPTTRNRTFDYAKNMRNQIPLLQQLRIDIEKNPNDPSLKTRLLNVATEIATSTSSMLTSDNSDKVQAVLDSARKCAEHTKNLVTSFEKGAQEFIDECKRFAGAALDLTKALQTVATVVEDKQHQRTIIEAYNSIKDFAPQVIRGAKKAYENPKNLQLQQELTLLSKKMATIISHAISVSQLNSPVEIGKKEDTVPIPKLEPAQEGVRRRRTIRDVKQGTDVLSKARMAAVAQEVNKTIDEGSVHLIAKQNAVAAQNTPEEEKEEEKPHEEQTPVEENKEVKEQTDSFIQTIRSHKEEQPIDKNEVEQLRTENSLLRQEVDELKEEIETLKKKVSDRDARLKALIAKK